MRAPFLLAVSLLLLPPAALAQPGAKPAMPAGHPPIGGAAAAPPSPWSAFADYALTVKVPPRGEAGTWTFRTYADPADVMVEMDTPGPKGRTRGSLLLVGGQAIATKGFAPEPGYEVDPLDAAIVNLKLLVRLLDAAAPGGPASLTGKLAVDAREAKSAIVVSTPTANARLGAPWALTGTLERTGAGAIRFALAVETPGEKPKEKARWSFSGTASGASRDRVLDPATRLAGWTLYALGPVKTTKPASSHTALRFGATKLSGPFATLEDLRAALK